jgi:hypothetical protein
MTVAAIALAGLLVLFVATLWLTVARRWARIGSSAPARLPVAAVPATRPAPARSRPRLPGLTRTTPLPTLGAPRRASAVRLVPPNAFSDEA